MSTPVIERPGTPGRPSRPQTGRAAAPRIPAQRGSGEARRAPDTRRSRVARENTGRAKFVLLVMVLLATGLVATLWLSTAAAVDSYALQDARQRTAALTEQSEALRKEVSVLESPASLARRAAAQGLIPTSDPARLVVAPDGRVDVVGEPRPAVGVAPALPAPAAPEQPAPEQPAAPEQAAPEQAAPEQRQGVEQEGTEREIPTDTRAAGGRG